jgi:PEP-CTERM motif
MRLLTPCLSSLIALAATLSLLPSQSSEAYTPVFYDGYGVSADAHNINLDVGAPRQGGPLIPVPYVTNTPNAANDYHHQVFSAGTSPSQPLQLAGDAFVLGFGTDTPVLVSPNYDFKGAVGGGILGKRITFNLDVGVIANPHPQFNTYTWGAVSVGAGSNLVQHGGAASHFGIRFIEDNLVGLPGGGVGNVIQLYDGNTVVDNGPAGMGIPNPAGAGPMSVQLDINDLVDGNPWDGVGSTTIDVYVNAALIGSYTKGGGGYTNNRITLEGASQTAGLNLATHLFDNLTVYAAPIPEPATWTLLSLGLCSLAMRRRNRS